MKTLDKKYEIVKLDKQAKLELINEILVSCFEKKGIEITTSESLSNLLNILERIGKESPFTEFFPDITYELIGYFHKNCIETLKTTEIISKNEAVVRLEDISSGEFIQGVAIFEKHRDITSVTADILASFILCKYVIMHPKEDFYKPNFHEKNCAAFDTRRTWLKYPNECNCEAKKILDKYNERPI
jgi:hypothetical protein